MAPSIDVLVAFEGGGAKAISHVAMLAALEEASKDFKDGVKLRTVGFAGTSSGSLVAALAAAGATSRCLLRRSDNDSGSVPLIEALGLPHLTDMFGADGWLRLRDIRNLFLSGNFFLRRLLVLVALYFVALHAASTLPDAFSLFPVWALSAWATYLVLKLTARKIATSFFGSSEETIGPAGQQKNYTVQHHIRLRQLKFAASCLAFCWAIAAIWWPQPLEFLSRYLKSGLASPWDNVVTYGLMASTIIGAVALRARSFFRGSISTNLARNHLNHALALLLSADCYSLDGRPLAQSSSAKNELDRLLKEGVTFGDLKSDLFVVTTDLSSQKMVLFSKEGTPNENVAFAVVASAAIPFIFRAPVRAKQYFADGALISNLPAWTFRHMCNLDPDVRILTVGVEDAEDLTDDIVAHVFERGDEREKAIVGWRGRLRALKLDATRPWISCVWPFLMAFRIVKVAVFGVRSIEVDSADKIDHITLDSKLGLLEFDKTAAEALKIKDTLQQKAESHIRHIYRAIPAKFENLCTEIINDVLIPRCHTTSPGFRCYLAEKLPRAQGMRPRYRYGFQTNQLDDRLLLPLNSTIAGFAYTQGESMIIDRSTIDLEFGANRDRYRRAAVSSWAQWKWCMSVGFPEDLMRTDDYGVFVIECNTAPQQFFDEITTAIERDRDFAVSFLSGQFDEETWDASPTNLSLDILARDQLEPAIRELFIGYWDMPAVKGQDLT